MALTKREEIDNPNSCLNKAADDEPVFVIRAKDSLAPVIVRRWAAHLEGMGGAPQKVAEARAWADKAENYPGRKVPD
jgi:hypothetical protein